MDRIGREWQLEEGQLELGARSRVFFLEMSYVHASRKTVFRSFRRAEENAGGLTPDTQAVTTCKNWQRSSQPFSVKGLFFDLLLHRPGKRRRRRAAGPRRWRRRLLLPDVRRLQLGGEHVEHDLHVLVAAGLHVLVELQDATVACIMTMSSFGQFQISNGKEKIII